MVWVESLTVTKVFFSCTHLSNANACLTLWLFAVELWVWALRISSSFFYSRKLLYSWRFCSIRLSSVLAKISAMRSVLEKAEKRSTGSGSSGGGSVFLGARLALGFALGVALELGVDSALALDFRVKGVKCAVWFQFNGGRCRIFRTELF